MPPIFIAANAESGFLPSLWGAIKAAFSATVHISFSTSYLSFSLGLLVECLGIFWLLRDTKPARGRGWRMLKAWCKRAIKKRGQLAWIVLGVGLVFFLAPFIFNFWVALRVFVWNHPHVQLTWQQQTSGFEVMPGFSEQIEPSYFEHHEQYVALIDYSEDNVLPVSLRVEFQFPFPVDHWSVTTPDAEVPGNFFPRQPSVPVLLNNRDLTLRGQPHYLNWTLVIPTIEPGRKIRLVVILNSDAEGPVAQWGPPPRRPITPFHARLANPFGFIYVTTRVSFGDQAGQTEIYAPFQIGKGDIVSLGNWQLPPNPIPFMEQVF
jgi:hypothetical protein